jgi:hypothetical protein
VISTRAGRQECITDVMVTRTKARTSKGSKAKDERGRSKTSGQQIRLLSKQLKRATASPDACQNAKEKRTKKGKAKGNTKPKKREEIIAENIEYLKCM